MAGFISNTATTVLLAPIAIALGNIAAVKLVARKRVDASRRLLQEGGKLVGTAMNGLKIIDTLKANRVTVE